MCKRRHLRSNRGENAEECTLRNHAVGSFLGSLHRVNGITHLRLSGRGVSLADKRPGFADRSAGFGDEVRQRPPLGRRGRQRIRFPPRPVDGSESRPVRRSSRRLRRAGRLAAARTRVHRSMPVRTSVTKPVERRLGYKSLAVDQHPERWRTLMSPGTRPRSSCCALGELAPHLDQASSTSSARLNSLSISSCRGRTA